MGPRRHALKVFRGNLRYGGWGNSVMGDHPLSFSVEPMLSHCPSQMDNFNFWGLSLLSIHPMVTPLSLPPFFVFQLSFFVSLLSEHGGSQLQRQTISTSLNQQVLFLQHLRETRLWLKHELLPASLDPPTCPRMCSSNKEHVKQLCGTLHSHARVPPNTPSVNWSLGSVGSPDSTSYWSGGGGLVLGRSV